MTLKTPGGSLDTAQEVGRRKGLLKGVKMRKESTTEGRKKEEDRGQREEQLRAQMLRGETTGKRRRTGDSVVSWEGV